MARKYTYWISTALLCVIYIMGAAFYIAQTDTVRQALAGLGYPTYLVPILISVKILGVVAILSRANVALSDLAYAGMFYHLLLALSAHLNASEYSGSVPAMVGLVMVVCSFLTQNAARKKKSPYALSDTKVRVGAV